MVEYCMYHKGSEKLIQNFGQKTEGKRPLGRPRHREKDNDKTDLNKWCVRMIQVRVQSWSAVNMVMNLQVP
jgi:hypothetical protein